MLVEAAVTTVTLILLAFGVIDFGRALLSYHALANGAKMGTRYALVRGYDSGSPTNATAVSDYVKSVLGLDPALVTVATNWQDSQKAGTWVRVQVNYSFQFIIPISSITMSSHSQVVIAR